MPAILQAGDLVMGDPEELKNKIGIVLEVIKSLSPMANMYSAALALEGIKWNEAAYLIGKIGEGMENTTPAP